MNPAIAIPQHEVGLLRKFDELATLAGLSPTRVHDDLSPKIEKLVSSLQSFINDMSLRCIEQKTAEDFQRVRDDVFQSYFALSVSLSMVAESTIPQATLERLISESCSEAESDFRKPETLSLLGGRLRDQAVFTVWTFRKTADLLMTIAKHPVVGEEQKIADKQFAADFSLFVAWTQFHMECLSAALRHEKVIYPEVADVVLDGLRGGVNAYTFARQGVELRMPSIEPQIAPYELDEEDRELLKSSMADLGGECA